MAVTSEDEPIVETPGSPGGIYASIDKLREIMGRCFDGEPLDGELADWLGEAIDGYLTRQFQTLEEALGLVFSRGGIPWWREEANRTRDAALRSLAETFFRELDHAKQARKIGMVCARYAATAWRFDRDRSEMPGH